MIKTRLNNIILLLILIILSAYIVYHNFSIDFKNNDYIPVDGTGDIKNLLTGSVISGDETVKTGKFTIELLSGFSLQKVNKSEYDYPVIQVNSKVDKVKIIAEIDFTNWFEKTYNYENETNYFFALKFFIGSFDNGGFYNVFRNERGGVSNDLNIGLNGAKPSIKIRDLAKREIDLSRVLVAKEAGNYGYTYFYGLDYLNTNIGKQLPIGVYLSSTKEIKGRNLTYIKSLKIEYVGEEGAITLK